MIVGSIKKRMQSIAKSMVKVNTLKFCLAFVMLVLLKALYLTSDLCKRESTVRIGSHGTHNKGIKKEARTVRISWA